MDKFKVGETVIYIGRLYSKYTNKECVILEKRKKWYKVKFDDGTEFHTVGSALKELE